MSLDSPYVLSQRHCDQSKSLSQTNQWDQAWKKETHHTPLPTGCWRYLVPICLRFEAFDERALLGTFLTIKIILSLIESGLTVISILRVADFSWWYILFLSSLQEKQSSELFWLISERVRHFRRDLKIVKIKMCAANLITSRPFKIKLINGMATRYIVNAIPGLSRFLWRAGLYKNFILVKKQVCCCLIQKDWFICALSEEYLTTILLSWLIKRVHQILQKKYTQKENWITV